MPFTPVSELGEFGLIERLQAVLEAGGGAPHALVQGIGDDAAVYRVGEGRVHVVTTDALVEASTSTARSRRCATSAGKRSR